MKRTINRTRRICPRCHATFSPSSRHKLCAICRRKSERHPCSCGKTIWGPSKLCVTCHNRLQKPNIGNLSYHKKGYIMERTTEGFVFQHILVIERRLNRKLLETEHVHHINGIKDDNRPGNLELWTRPHPAGIRAKDALKWALQIVETYSPIKDLL